MDEKSRISAVIAGDVEAYAELVLAHQAKIRLVCLTYLHNASEADDAAQDTFIKAYKALSSFKGESSLETWLSRIAANHCRDQLRTRKRQQTVSLDAMLDEKGDQIQALFRQAAGEQVYTPEDLELLGRLLSTLSEEEREILILREVDQLPYDEIASKLQCSLDAVKGRLKRVRARLEKNGRSLFDTFEEMTRP